MNEKQTRKHIIDLRLTQAGRNVNDQTQVVIESTLGSDTLNEPRWPKVGENLILMVSIKALEEQKAIVKQVNRLMALCDSLEEHLEHNQTQLEQLMQSFLSEVFKTNYEFKYLNYA